MEKLSSIENVVKELEGDFTERAWSIVVRRFGVGQDERETLEAIGKSYDITRERVRQIENETLAKLEEEEKYSRTLSPFHENLEMFLIDHGGLMHEELLADRFIDRLEEDYKWRGFVELLLNLGQAFQYRREDEHFHGLWYVQEQSLKQAHELLEEVVEFFEEEQQLLSEEEFQNHVKKNYPFFSEKAFFTYLECSKKVSSNVFNDYGLRHWSEITPRGVRNKAYLVVKKHGEPLHFREITEQINEAGFSDKEAKPQTVHNELIKDERFVLVGRGTYALKSWGYEPGTVKEVIKKVLKNRSEPLHEEEIIEEVLERRMVKEGTIKFNLKANEEFAEVEEKHYTLG